MDMLDHDGPDTLDAIATRFYGRKYIGQQTGDMLPNDSHVVYDMDEDMVEQLIANLEEEREYSGFDSLQRWLDAASPADRSEEIKLIRSAPEPDYILADLISKGELPHGKYVVRVWW
jgi:hypothetical protein